MRYEERVSARSFEARENWLIIQSSQANGSRLTSLARDAALPGMSFTTFYESKKLVETMQKPVDLSIIVTTFSGTGRQRKLRGSFPFHRFSIATLRMQIIETHPAAWSPRPRSRVPGFRSARLWCCRNSSCSSRRTAIKELKPITIVVQPAPILVIHRHAKTKVSAWRCS